MKEFKYKGATVRPYEPFHEHYSERFFSGSIGGGYLLPCWQESKI